MLKFMLLVKLLEKNNDMSIAEMIDKWLTDHSAKERMQQFASEELMKINSLNL